MDAEELVRNESNFLSDDYEEIADLMVKFAKFHVKNIREQLLKDYGNEIHNKISSIVSDIDVYSKNIK